MTDAPERIWLTTTESGKVDDFTQWLDNQFLLSSVTPRTEYVRADLYRNIALDALASSSQAQDAYAAQLKAEAMAEKLAKEGANLFAEIDRSRGDIESPYVRVAFGMFQRALAEYEASK